jgi:hypothetical protein
MLSRRGRYDAVYASLADEPERAAKLDRAFFDFVTRAKRGR